METDNNSLLPSIGLTFLALLRFLGVLLIGYGVASYLVQWSLGIKIGTESQLFDIINASEDPQKILLKMQGISAFLAYLVFPLIYLLTFKQDLRAAFKINTPDFFIFLSLAILTLFMVMPTLAYLVDWNSHIHLPEYFKSVEEWMVQKEELAKEMTNLLIDASGRSSYFWILMVVAIIPAFGEEFLFRGILQNELYQATKNYHFAIWTAGFLFSFIHFQFFGFFPRMLLGVLFGYLYFWSGNILIPISVHFLNNALTLVMMNLYKSKQTNFNPESIESISPLMMVISFGITLFLLFTYRYYYKKNKSRLFAHDKILLNEKE